MTDRTYNSFDLETYLIRPGLAAPRMVCLSYDAGEGGRVVLADEGLALFWGWITDPEVVLIGHHVFYDLGVLVAMDPSLLPLVFQAIDEGRIRCTKVREMIVANAKGELKFEWDPDLGEMKRSSFSLETLSWRYLGRSMKKGADSWRLRYAELEGVPVSEWPEEARAYAIQDAEDTRAVFFAQGPTEIHGEVGQVQAAWALALMRVWGVRTDPDAVDALRETLEIQLAEAKKEAQEYGLIRRGPKESKDTKAIRARVKEWYESRGRKVPLAKYKGKKSPPPPPNISTDRETLTDTDDPGLLAVAQVTRFEKLLSTYVPVLEHGAYAPVTPDWNPIIETFRTSCARPNLQNLPR